MSAALKIVDADDHPLAGVDLIECDVLEALETEDGFPAAQEMRLTYELLGHDLAVRLSLWHIKPMAVEHEGPGPIASGIVPADMITTDTLVAALRTSRMIVLRQINPAG